MGRQVRILIAFVCVFAAAPSKACDIPVYRYALEHWSPDAYQIAVLHQGPMDTHTAAVVAALQKPSDRGPNGNYTVRVIDAARPADDAARDLCRNEACGDGPRVVVRLPGAGNRVVWDGPLNGEAAAELADSPCRRRIADRLLAGESAVWVLLQCGRKAEDDAAIERVQKELNRPIAEGQPAPTCSLVCVSRADPAEKLLVETLLTSEPDLRGRDEPMAFPVFGRGRVLYALVGAGVDGENVRHALDFLVGGCSCTIKRENPGVDLPLTADWGVVTPTTPEETHAPPADEIVPLSPLPTKPARIPSPSDTPSRGPDWRLPAGVIAAAFLVLVTGWFAFRSIKPPP